MPREWLQDRRTRTMTNTKPTPWREAVITFDVFAGGALTLVAGWAWLVCEVNGGACPSLLWMLPAGALLATSGALVGDGTAPALLAALLCKLASAGLLGVAA